MNTFILHRCINVIKMNSVKHIIYKKNNFILNNAVSRNILSSTVFNINNNNSNFSWVYQHIIMISEGSCDTDVMMLKIQPWSQE